MVLKIRSDHHLVGIDTKEVIEAASTKWNFIPIHPGLVGGHCIDIVPYYLESKAAQLGYHPNVISAARKTNEGMAKFIAHQVLQKLSSSGIIIAESKINILGLSFKENIKDLSNSKIIDLINHLKAHDAEVFIHDPLAHPEDAMQQYGIKLSDWESLPVADAMIIATPHQQFLSKPLSELTSKLQPKGCFFDLHSSFDTKQIQQAGFRVWRL